MRRSTRNNAAARPRPDRWTIRFLPAALLILLVPPMLADGRESGYQIERGKIQGVLHEVLNSQKDPRNRDSKLKALEEYESFILSHFDYKSDLKAEAIHRLADLYMKLETNTHARKLETYYNRLRLYAKGKLPERPGFPKIDHARSIRLYEALLQQYPQRAANDAALYQLARGYAEQDRIMAALETLQRLIDQHSGSPYVQEAHFRMGEFYFDLEDLRLALASYRRALEYADEEFLDMGFYKMGWTQFALSDYAGSAQSFLSLLDRKAVATGTGKKQLLLYKLPELEADLIKEAVRTLLLSFDELGGPAAMVEYFAERGRKDYEPYLYRSLSELYVEQERFGEAVSSLETFVTAHPLDEEAPAMQAALIDLHTLRKNGPAAIAAKEKFVVLFGSGGEWARRAPETARRQIEPLMKETAFELLLHHFATARRSGNPGDYRISNQWARRFLREFPDSIEAAKASFLLAEGLFDLKRYAAAAAQYEKTAEDYPLHSHTQDAAYNRLLAIENDRDQNETALAKALFHYTERYREDPRGDELLLKAARLAARAGDQAASREYAQNLIDRSPPARIRYRAHRLIADGYFEERAFSKAVARIERILSEDPPFEISRKELDELQLILASSLYKMAEGELSAGRPAEAAAGYLRIHDRVPGSPVAAGALLDGSVLLADIGKDKEAITALHELIASYPRSEHVVRAREHLAVLYERRERLGKAIEQYEILARESDGARVLNWHWAIAELSQQTKDWGRAKRAFMVVAERAPRGDERRIEALLQAARACNHLEEPRQEEVLMKRVLEAYSAEEAPTARMARHAAQASFSLGERHLAEFVKIRLAPPLETTLKRKQELLDAALNYYSKTVDFEIPEYITASTYKVGYLFEAFRDSLLESERPRGLTGEQLEQYDFILEEKAYPFEENAIAAYETNVERSRRGNHFDEWIEKSYSRLAQLLPARYKREEMAEIFTKGGLF